MEILVGKDIVQVTSSTNQEDMFIVVLTLDGMLNIYDITLERKFNTLQPNAEANRERHL